MKKIVNVLSFILCTSLLLTAFAACANESSGDGYDSSESRSSTISSDFVSVPGTTVSGAVSDSGVFISGRSVRIPNMYVCDHEVTQKEY